MTKTYFALSDESDQPGLSTVRIKKGHDFDFQADHSLH